MQEFIRFYEKEKSRIPKKTRKHKRHAILKARGNAIKRAKAFSIKTLLDSLEENPSELLVENICLSK